jgi:hypothetical protein
LVGYTLPQSLDALALTSDCGLRCNEALAHGLQLGDRFSQLPLDVVDEERFGHHAAIL